MKELQVKLLSKNAVVPIRSHDTDSGLDLVTPKSFTVKKDEPYMLDFEIAVNIPEGYEGEIRARSGLGSIYGLKPRQGVGTIDSGYHGSLKCMFVVDVDYLHINKGERVAQLIISPIVTPKPVIVENFQEKTSRGEGGFGSSGR